MWLESFCSVKASGPEASFLRNSIWEHPARYMHIQYPNPTWTWSSLINQRQYKVTPIEDIDSVTCKWWSLTMPKLGYYLVQITSFISLKVYCWYIGYCEQKEMKNSLYIEKIKHPKDTNHEKTYYYIV